MSNVAKILRVLVVLAIAGGVGVLIGWLQGKGNENTPPPIVVATNQAPVVIAPIVEESKPKPAPVQKPFANRQHKPTPPPEIMSPRPGEMKWEKDLDDILLGDGEPNDKADKILALLPTAPASAQVELSQHLVNMVQDDHYDGTAQLLTNAATPAAVSTVLMNDLLNRNANLKLPMLLAVARDSDHPLNGQARDMLELLLQQDNGTNWDQWGASINTWLQDNPQ